MEKFFAGIGSKTAPEEILIKMTKYARILEILGYKLRSGHAKGSDKAFEIGILNPKNKEIFVSKDAQDWAIKMVRDKYLPQDYLPRAYDEFEYWKPFVKGLLGRNMMQILGKNGDVPVDFVICWTPPEDYQTSKVGGTGYAVRCALALGIPVYNLVYEEDEKKLKEFISGLIKEKNNL